MKLEVSQYRNRVTRFVGAFLGVCGDLGKLRDACSIQTIDAGRGGFGGGWRGFVAVDRA